MITKPQTFLEKYRAEHGSEIGIACDITANLIGVVYYDLTLRRRYARVSFVGGEITPMTAGETLIRLITGSMRELGISASSVREIGVAAPMYIESSLEEELSPSDFFLPPSVGIFFVPYISAAISGRFTASLLTLPDGDCVAADFGRTFCAALKHDNRFTCASFSLMGAFDGTGLESGMPAENGAIDAVRRDSDGTIVYEVVGDGASIGVSPAAAMMAAEVMLKTGALDSDGIMTDRDLFYIGEDFFVSQSDIRVIQSDKARAAAALKLLPKADKAYFSGEPFSTAAGMKALLKLGGFPEWCREAAFCRNSSEQGIILCLEEPKMREKAFEIAEIAEDITETLISKFDEEYFDCLSFPEEI